MPALDFPASPTDGQVYGNWIWSSSKGAWQAKPMESAKTVTSDVPPANPADGDQWFSTVDGVLYVYVVDIDGGQWVESRSAIISDGYYSPNYVINGGMDVWQRGTSFTNPANNAYTADRWQVQHNGTGATRTISQQAFSPGTNLGQDESASFFRYAVSVAGSGNTYNGLLNKIEDVRTLAGKTVTFSFWAKADATRNVTFDIERGFGSGGSSQTNTVIGTVSLSTSWARYSLTTTIAALTGLTVGANSYVAVRWQLPAGTSFTVDIWGVQLEEGSVATPFRRNANSLQGELAACQRYYEKSYHLNTPPFTNTTDGLFTFYGTSDGASNAVAPVRFAVPKRSASYTLTTYTTTTSGQMGYQRSGVSGTASSILYRSNENMFHVYCSVGVTWSACAVDFHWTCSAEL